MDRICLIFAMVGLWCRWACRSLCVTSRRHRLHWVCMVFFPYASRL